MAFFNRRSALSSTGSVSQASLIATNIARQNSLVSTTFQAHISMLTTPRQNRRTGTTTGARSLTRCVPLLVLKLSPNLCQFSLSPDPTSWGSNLSPEHPEPDDYIHNPDPRSGGRDSRGQIFTLRGLSNLGCLIFLCLSLLTLLCVITPSVLLTLTLLFSAGYPLISHFTAKPMSTNGGFNLGGINATGQVSPLFVAWVVHIVMLSA